MKKIETLTLLIIFCLFSTDYYAQTWSAIGSGTNFYVYSFAEYNSELYVGCGFSSDGGNTANNIAKWDGTNWPALNSEPDVSVLCMHVNNVDLCVGGSFYMMGSVSSMGIASWDGNTWSGFGTGMQFSGIDYSITSYNSELYAAGDFITADGNNANNIAKWTGATWSPLSLGLNFSVQTLGVYNGNLDVGGEFTNAGGSPANYIAKWNNPIGLKNHNISNDISVYPNPVIDKVVLEINRGVKK